MHSAELFDQGNMDRKKRKNTSIFIPSQQQGAGSAKASKVDMFPTSIPQGLYCRADPSRSRTSLKSAAENMQPFVHSILSISSCTCRRKIQDRPRELGNRSEYKTCMLDSSPAGAATVKHLIDRLSQIHCHKPADLHMTKNSDSAQPVHTTGYTGSSL